LVLPLKPRPSPQWDRLIHVHVKISDSKTPTAYKP
jgi:hypothetical protein